VRFVALSQDGRSGLAIETTDGLRGFLADDPLYPGSLMTLLAEDRLEGGGERLAHGRAFAPGSFTYAVPVRSPSKILCIGLNYREHAAEASFEPPTYPTVFARFSSSLVPHAAPLVRPLKSRELDFEGELVAIIGRRAYQVSETNALRYVAGYSIFNEASVRDYQMKSSQWTMGKNFDGTGGFGPLFVTADELPLGASGLLLETRLNGVVVQSMRTDAMIFDVASLVATISAVMTLEPGDVIVTGTPSGVGAARKPPLWMADGDVCEVSIEGIGSLRNPIVDESTTASLDTVAHV
jgi:2-keto-4-pentenoate hydratase/2-oxohepta-3-ene-1,7-dioic acid hydratase in catechol pathway